MLGVSLWTAGCNIGLGENFVSKGAVVGKITTASGQPVAGARVDLHIAPVLPFAHSDSTGTTPAGECVRSMAGGVAAISDRKGEFGQSVSDSSLSPPFEICLDVEVTPPEGSGLQPKTVANLRFRLAEYEARRTPRLRVDVALDSLAATGQP